MTLFVKALNDAGVTIPIFAYYAGGSPARRRRWRRAGSLEVYQIAYNHSNYGGELGALMDEFRPRSTTTTSTPFAIYNGIVMLSDAMAKAKSTDPMKVAAALEGLRFQRGFNGESEMRKTDHQLQQGLWISKWQKVDAKNKYSVENTGYLRAGEVPRAPHREHADVVRHEAP